jgi:hypothetical protein
MDSSSSHRWFSCLERFFNGNYSLRRSIIRTDSFDTVNATTTATNATAAGRVNTTSITMTNKDSVAAGDICRLRITRNADDGSDTLAEDARLAGVIVEWN